MDPDHAVLGDGKGMLLFLLLPPLLANVAALASFLTHSPTAKTKAAALGARMRRAVAVGYTTACFYFYLPAAMVWQVLPTEY